MRVNLTRHRRQVVAATAAAVLAGACIGDGEAPSARAESGDSTAVALVHVNGAVLDSVPQPPSSASAGAANASSSNGSVLIPSRAGQTSGRDAVSAVDTTPPSIPPVAPVPSGEVRRPADAAPTPDELSALAASLVVPVAGVTPAELRGSFHAPRGGGTRQHNALDIPAPRGTPVISATPGRVLRLFNSKAGGLMIYAADATERFILMYGHLDRYADGIKDGMRLERGQTIGYVGTTGNAPPSLPHLHFAIARTNNVSRWWNGTPIDPTPLFKR